MKVSFAKPEAAVVGASVSNAEAAVIASANPAPATAPCVATADSPQSIAATVPTPVPGVVVETVTTVAAPAAPSTPAMQVTDNAGAVAIVPKTDTAVAESKPAFYDDETIDPGDLVLPRFNIVQKVGDLSNQFAPGTILLNAQLALVKAPEKFDLSGKIKLLIAGFMPTVFVEKLEGGAQGNLFRTEAEVVAAGGTLDWNEAQATKKQLYQRLATAMILIEQPEGLDPESFPTEIEGKRYALALYSMKGSAYTNATKNFKSARKIGHLKQHGYRGGWWTLQSQLKKFGDNYAYIPVVKAAGSSTPEFRAALLDLLGF